MQNRNIIITIIAVVIVIALGGFFVMRIMSAQANSPATTSSQSDNNPAATPDNSGSSGSLPTNSPQSSTSPSVQGSAVNIINFTFTPSTLTVSKGTIVTWTNNDSVAHQIKSNSFNSALLNPGDTFQFTFSKAGTYNYTCAIHPMMAGQIIVQ